MDIHGNDLICVLSSIVQAGHLINHHVVLGKVGFGTPVSWCVRRRIWPKRKHTAVRVVMRGR